MQCSGKVWSVNRYKQLTVKASLTFVYGFTDVVYHIGAQYSNQFVIDILMHFLEKKKMLFQILLTFFTEVQLTIHLHWFSWWLVSHVIAPYLNQHHPLHIFEIASGILWDMAALLRMWWFIHKSAISSLFQVTAWKLFSPKLLLELSLNYQSGTKPHLIAIRHSVLMVITIGWSHLQSASNEQLKLVYFGRVGYFNW